MRLRSPSRGSQRRCAVGSLCVEGRPPSISSPPLQYALFRHVKDQTPPRRVPALPPPQGVEQAVPLPDVPVQPIHQGFSCPQVKKLCEEAESLQDRAVTHPAPIIRDFSHADTIPGGPDRLGDLVYAPAVLRVVQAI